MTAATTVREPDPLLLPYLRATTEADARRQIQHLMQETAAPILRAVIRRKLRVYLRGPDARTRLEQDALDVFSNAELDLLMRLDTMRSNPEAAIANFRGYASVTAVRACDLYLRQRYPRRASLKDKLFYLLDNRTGQTGFARWDGEGGETIAGFEDWKTEGRAVVRSARMEQLGAAPAQVVERIVPREDVRRMNLAQLLAAVFNWLGHPCELDDLVQALAVVLGVRDEPHLTDSDVETEDRAGASLLDRHDPRQDVEPAVSAREFLRGVWAAVLDLPERYRVPLLLNLRDNRGRGVIALLPIQGVATLPEIASAVGMEPREFAALWNELPLDDAAIAARLGIGRQDVINRRMQARRKLAKLVAE